MYKKVSTSMDFVEREKEILAYWKEHDVFNKCFTMREGAPYSPFSTARLRPTAGPTSAMWKPAPSRT